MVDCGLYIGMIVDLKSNAMRFENVSNKMEKREEKYKVMFHAKTANAIVNLTETNISDGTANFIYFLFEEKTNDLQENLVERKPKEMNIYDI